MYVRRPLASINNTYDNVTALVTIWERNQRFERGIIISNIATWYFQYYRCGGDNRIFKEDKFQSEPAVFSS